MKALFLIIVLACMPAFAGAADNSSVNGKWKVHFLIANVERDIVCTFIQKDVEFTGNCKGDDTESADLTGKVDGKNVSWTYKAEYNGTPITVNYSGSLDATTKISGTMDVPEYSATGDFTAIQAN